MVALAGPHVLLAIIAVSYIICGAWLFHILEGNNFRQQVDNYANRIESDQNKILNFAWNLTQKVNMSQDVFEDVMLNEFEILVDTTYQLHFEMGIVGSKAVQGKINASFLLDDSYNKTWDILSSVFFTTTMLLSIGYGMLTPLTTIGRGFCVAYCLVGIPLTLVAIANMAKFLSEIMYFMHFRWVQLKLGVVNGLQLWYHRLRGEKAEERKRILASSLEDTRMARVLDFEEDYLDSLMLVQFPPLPLFVLMLLYAFFGAYIIGGWEQWDHGESIYFAFVSILTIGFGDFVPKNRDYLMASLVYIVVGVVLTTTCIDIVGGRYLEDIHNIGRKLGNTDPLSYVRKMKMRSRKKAMAGLLAQMAQALVMSRSSDPQTTDDLIATRTKKKKRRRKSCDSTQVLLGRAPPDPPMDCQVLSTSAYSVKLAWAPSYSQYEVQYTVKCRLKHIKNAPSIEMSGITQCHVEIKGLVSCSLYEFILTAYNVFGPSHPVYLVQYTEPELSPQHIIMERLGPFTVRLLWELPFKRWKRTKEYIVYYSQSAELPFDQWQKTYTQERWALFATLERDKIYYFCVRAVFDDNQHSPLSRSLPFKTENPDRLKGVGKCKSVEIMENMSERLILPPLPREFASTNTIVEYNTDDNEEFCSESTNE